MEKLVKKRYGDNFTINKSLFLQQTEQFDICFIQFDLAHVSCYIFFMSEIFINSLLNYFFVIFLKSKLPHVNSCQYIECIHYLVIALTIGTFILAQFCILCTPLGDADWAYFLQINFGKFDVLLQIFIA